MVFIFCYLKLQQCSSKSRANLRKEREQPKQVFGPICFQEAEESSFLFFSGNLQAFFFRYTEQLIVLLLQIVFTL